MRYALIIVAAVVYALTGTTSSAVAAGYTFTIVNRLNSYIPSKDLNADAVCSATVKLTTGSGVVATGSIPSVKAGASGTIQLSALVCNLEKVVVTCQFKDYAGNKKTETKESGFNNCGGGNYYISLEPFLNPKWTSFSVSKL